MSELMDEAVIRMPFDMAMESYAQSNRRPTMTTNKPEIVAWFKPASHATLNSVDAVITDRSMKDRPEISNIGFTEPLVRLSEYEALQAKCENLRAKLAELESQEPYAWTTQDASGRCYFTPSREAAERWTKCGWRTWIVEPLYAKPAPADKPAVEVPDAATPEMEAAAEKYWNERWCTGLTDDPRTWAGVYAAMVAAYRKGEQS